MPCAPGPCGSPPSFVAVMSSLSPPHRDPVAADVRHAALRRGGGKSLFPVRGFFWMGDVYSVPTKGLSWAGVGKELPEPLGCAQSPSLHVHGVSEGARSMEMIKG